MTLIQGISLIVCDSEVMRSCIIIIIIIIIIINAIVLIKIKIMRSVH